MRTLQQAQALFLVHEIEQIELGRKRQRLAMPWLNWEEVLDVISKRLLWPQGTAKSVLMQLVVEGALVEHVSGRAIRPSYRSYGDE